MQENLSQNISIFQETKRIARILVLILLILSIATFESSGPENNWLGLIGHLIGYCFRFTLGILSYPILIMAIFHQVRLLRSPSYSQDQSLPSKLQLNILALGFFSLGILTTQAAFYAPIFFHSVLPYSLASIPLDAKYICGYPITFIYRLMPFINLYDLLGDGGISMIFTSSTALCAWLLFRHNQLQKPSKISQPSARRSLKALLQRHKAFSPKKALIDTAKEEDRTKESQKQEKKAQSINALSLLKAAKKNSPHAFILPSCQLLTVAKAQNNKKMQGQLDHLVALLEETLLSFGIEAKVGQVHIGPRVLSFEVHPPIGVKVQRIKALENDIALNLQAKSIRIIAPIPGKAAVGIEIPSPHPQEVNFQEMVKNYQASKVKHAIPVILGKTVHGDDITFDLTKMPHMIIAGATGSGKSVCINTIIMSILMHAGPEEIKLLMIDPKKVELTPYTKLPHMIAPVITEPQHAADSLKWLVREMEKRYEILKVLGLRHIHAFNSRKRDEEAEQQLNIQIPGKMPFIVGIVDELADLMMTSPSDIETPIARIAQMARAVGIHLILATQRPSREVITGLIKANFPARIAFKVASKINSQIILDETGAESLLGNGDMLFLHPAKGVVSRAQGVFVSDEDIAKVLETIEMQAPANYWINPDQISADLGNLDEEEVGDELYSQARQIVIDTQTASTTFLQRKLRIGYARAASLMDALEARGVVSASEGGKARKVLVGGQNDDAQDLF